MHPFKGNTFEELFHWLVRELAGKYDEGESKNIGYLLFEHYLHFSVSDLIVKKKNNCSKNDIQKITHAVIQLKNNTPVQYITGEVEFEDILLDVNQHVLIPRPETEELVFRVKKNLLSKGITQDKNLKIWDIGTGSGAIAISLAKYFPNAKVFGTDISDSALQTASKNAIKNHTIVEFSKHDILQDPIPFSNFDILISNPPYVRYLEKKWMADHILDSEPHLALFVPDKNPLVFYNAIARAGILALKRDGRVYVEINEFLGKETSFLFYKWGYKNPQLLNDFHQKNRFVMCTRT
ncbi:MAG: peptide chain release factor N(5)-glutamine methyltransferase [Bacteroidota bacterium]